MCNMSWVVVAKDVSVMKCWFYEAIDDIIRDGIPVLITPVGSGVVDVRVNNWNLVKATEIMTNIVTETSEGGVDNG